MTVLRRGELAIRDGRVLAEPGSGELLARGPYGPTAPPAASPTASTPPPPA